MHLKSMSHCISLNAYTWRCWRYWGSISDWWLNRPSLNIFIMSTYWKPPLRISRPPACCTKTGTSGINDPETWKYHDMKLNHGQVKWGLSQTFLATPWHASAMAMARIEQRLNNENGQSFLGAGCHKHLLPHHPTPRRTPSLLGQGKKCWVLIRCLYLWQNSHTDIQSPYCPNKY